MSEEIEVPFQVDGMYYRAEIHAAFGGQRQGGISTPAGRSAIILFTGEAGVEHGYSDRWDDDGTFHYFGEGQEGAMRMTRGNRAIYNHIADAKQLLLFQAMGKGRRCRYRGEFLMESYYEQPNTPATRGLDRTAIVFKLRQLNDPMLRNGVSEPSAADLSLGSTVTMRLLEVRNAQRLFKNRLLGVEKGCRLTGIQDARFLRASHIKPWAACADGNERVDGCNGLLLAPHADLLFDQGWISFEDRGGLIVSDDMPRAVIRSIGLNLTAGRRCGAFNQRQAIYLDHHRSHIVGKKYKKVRDPVQDLFSEISELR